MVVHDESIGGAAAPNEAPPVADDGVVAAPAPRSLAARVFTPPKHPWITAAAVVIAVMFLFEGFVRVIENQFETLRAGDSSEMILKAEGLAALPADQRHVGVVFFGNSMMDTAISPIFFTKNSKTYKTVYNASIVGAPLQTRLRWSNEIVLRDLDPDLIVIGIHPVDLLHTDFLKLNQDPQQADVIFGRVLRETDSSALGEVQRSLNDNLAIVRNRGVLRRPRTVWDASLREVRGQPKPKEFDVRTEEDWQQMLKPDGEVSMFHGQLFKQESIKNTGPKLKENLLASNYSTVELNSLLDNLQATGKKVVVVIPPVPLDAWQAAGVDLASLSTGNQLITDAAGARGMRVIDFTDNGFKNGLFGDILHANDKGSLQFSKQLAQELDQPG